MVRIIKKAASHIARFACDQYLVLFFTLTTSLKLIFLNTYVLKVTWDQPTYKYGLVISCLSVMVLFLPMYFVKKRRTAWTTLLAFLLTLLIFIDTVYFSYFGAIPSVGLLNAVDQTAGVVPAIVAILRWWMALYFVDILIALFLARPGKKLFDSIKYKYDFAKIKLRSMLIIAAIILVTFFLSLLPIGLKQLSNEVEKSFEAKTSAMRYGIYMAHLFDVIRYVKQETASLSASEEQAIVNWATDNKPVQATSDLTGIAKGKNVIMIQVESLGSLVIDQTINGKAVTPTLDSLAETSQFFPNERFLIGAGHTSDTDFVANTSYFPMEDAAIFVRFGRDDFDSLPKTLTANGYSTYAYHGYTRDSWNRSVAFKSLGYQKFYASDNYSKGVNINMGLNDSTFLSETVDYIKTQPKPSFSYVITLTSHSPFNITNETKDLGLNESDYPNQVAGYLEDIHYTDKALGEFFEKLKAEGLYDDSLIIVYGDHTPSISSFTAGTITYDAASVQAKEVPLFIKLPNETTGITYANQGSHLDIMPTVLDLLGIKTDQLMFGQSLFVNSSNAMTVCEDQIATFKSASNCKEMLATEKSKSAVIVRYNQFGNL